MGAVLKLRLLSVLFFLAALSAEAKSCLYYLGLERRELSAQELNQQKIKVLRLQLRQKLRELAIWRKPKPSTPSFYEREEIRYFLQRKYGDTWFVEGNALLQTLVQAPELKDDWGAHEKLLADGTYLFLIHESKLDYEEFHELEIEKTVFQIEVERDQIAVELMWYRREKENNPDLAKFIASNRHLIRTRERLTEHEAAMALVSDRLTNFGRLTKSLMKDPDYFLAAEAAGEASLYYEDYTLAYWKALGYKHAPERQD